MENNTFKSDLSGCEFLISERVEAKNIRKTLFDFIKLEHSQFNLDCVLSESEQNVYREKYITSFLEAQVGELTSLEKKVVKSLKERKTISTKVDDEEEKSTIGQKIADKVAEFGGSWTFILSFLGFLILWISFNVFMLSNKGFDPYPFILLNLILSCVAALQAPVIMMSQNRQEQKDRSRAKNDYMVNLKSEIEIRVLHEKIDHLIKHQEQSLLELQKIQIDMINEVLNHIKK